MRTLLFLSIIALLAVICLGCGSVHTRVEKEMTPPPSPEKNLVPEPLPDIPQVEPAPLPSDDGPSFPPTGEDVEVAPPLPTAKVPTSPIPPPPPEPENVLYAARLPFEDEIVIWQLLLMVA